MSFPRSLVTVFKQARHWTVHLAISVPFKYWQLVALRYIWIARSHYAQCARWHLPVKLCTRNFIRRPTACFLYTCRIYSMSPVARLTNVTVLINKFSLWYSPLFYIIFSGSVNPLFPILYIYIYIYIYIHLHIYTDLYPPTQHVQTS